MGKSDWSKVIADDGRPMINLVIYWRLFFAPSIIGSSFKREKCFWWNHWSWSSLFRGSTEGGEFFEKKTFWCFHPFSTISKGRFFWKDWEVSDNIIFKCIALFTTEKVVDFCLFCDYFWWGLDIGLLSDKLKEKIKVKGEGMQKGINWWWIGQIWKK